ncbi:STAS-like domain-containing protein [Salipiger bermudensis]|uniref:STAS-like domain-containing protein n=1 Tax=Salipiger bermudensis TaxID=344736 RepID=UPI001C992143|nr:STAS-like domain-containing protein [Salipiger bermudensis]
MEDEKMISIADFSRYPSGRDDNDGDFNGARFRETVLVPALEEAIQSGGRVCVSLKGVMSFGSSFLEEAFGGLIRSGRFTKEQIRSTMRVDPGRPNFSRHERTIWLHIDRAQ